MAQPQDAALTAILRGLMERQTFMAMVGPDQAGFGKALAATMTVLTPLVRVELVELDEAGERPAAGDPPRLTLGMLAARILRKPASAHEVADVEEVLTRLTRPVGTEARVVLILVGAGRLRADSFAYLQMAADLTSRTGMQLHVVFVAGAGFWHLLEFEASRLAERVLVRHDMTAPADAVLSGTARPVPPDKGFWHFDNRRSLAAAVAFGAFFLGGDVAHDVDTPPDPPAPAAEVVRLADNAAAPLAAAPAPQPTLAEPAASEPEDPAPEPGPSGAMTASPEPAAPMTQAAAVPDAAPPEPPAPAATMSQGEPAGPADMPPAPGPAAEAAAAPPASSDAAPPPEPPPAQVATPAPEPIPSPTPAAAQSEATPPEPPQAQLATPAPGDEAPEPASPPPAAPPPAMAEAAPAAAEAVPPVEAPAPMPAPAPVADAAPPADPPPVAAPEPPPAPPPVADAAPAAPEPAPPPPAPAPPGAPPPSVAQISPPPSAPPPAAPPPAAPPARAAAPPPPSAASQAMLDMLQRRGDEMFATGDVSAARRLYERGVAGRSARAAFALARTYDPRVLSPLGVKGVAADLPTATRLYRDAIGLGSEEARIALDRLLALSPDELAKLK